MPVTGLISLRQALRGTGSRCQVSRWLRIVSLCSSRRYENILVESANCEHGFNKRDYHAAYNLWGRDPQNPPPTYDQFASGYANTQHDDITFGTITPNADGTVTVDLTILAMEITSTGTVKSTYQGSYIVGQQNGAWKLLKGNFSKV